MSIQPLLADDSEETEERPNVHPLLRFANQVQTTPMYTQPYQYTTSSGDVVTIWIETDGSLTVYLNGEALDDIIARAVSGCVSWGELNRIIKEINMAFEELEKLMIEGDKKVKKECFQYWDRYYILIRHMYDPIADLAFENGGRIEDINGTLITEVYPMLGGHEFILQILIPERFESIEGDIQQILDTLDNLQTTLSEDQEYDKEEREKLEGRLNEEIENLRDENKDQWNIMVPVLIVLILWNIILSALYLKKR